METAPIFSAAPVRVFFPTSGILLFAAGNGCECFAEGCADKGSFGAVVFRLFSLSVSGVCPDGGKMNGKQRIRAGAAALGLVLLLQANARAAVALIPVGEAAGIALETQGALIVGFSERSAAKDAGIRTGDSIVSVDGAPVRGAAELSDALAGAGKDEVRLGIRRGKDKLEIAVTPDRSGETPRLGVFVRGAMTGIGTVTYYDPETGAFGALGHGVSAPGSQTLLPVTDGKLVACTPDTILPGSPGIPGELSGTPDADTVLGTIEKNTASGIFGRSETGWTGTPVPAASADEVRPGKAYLRSAVSGRICDYAIMIRAVRPADAAGRDMLIEVTDPALLALTGGIVRGMSGSPILQDGKLIGAVTHVLVSDPSKGYAIFMETMLAAARADAADDAA